MFEISKTKRLIPVVERFGSVSRTAFIDPALVDSIFQHIEHGKPTGGWVLYTTGGRNVMLTHAEFHRLLDLISTEPSGDQS